MGAKRHRVLGRCAGIMFLGAAIAGVPAALLLPGPLPSHLILVLGTLSAISGAICMAIPWQHLRAGWLNGVPPIAIAQITALLLVSEPYGEVFRWFYVLVAIFVAYAFRRRAVIAAHLSVLVLSMVGTSFFVLGDDAAMVARNVVGIPTICLAAGIVVWLRENLERRERTDPLTGLANRRALMEDLHALHESRTLALFDLDGFKRYNDRLGHAAGDALLRRFGANLRRAVDGHGTAYRLGGDELCVLVDDEERLLACDTALREGDISASYGAAHLPREASTPSAALSLVDARMYAAKRSTRDAPFVVDLSPSTPADSVPDPASPSPTRPAAA